MTVHFRIPAPLRALADGCHQVEVEMAGTTLQAALEALFAVHPGLRDRILTERGDIRQHINVFVGERDVRSMDGLATPLASGEEVSILPAISGG